VWILVSEIFQTEESRQESGSPFRRLETIQPSDCKRYTIPIIRLDNWGKAVCAFCRVCEDCLTNA
jgi:hypothetical protein